MIIKFPGTRGEIEKSSPSHKYHSSLIVEYRSTRMLIDLGIKHNPWLMDTVNDFSFILITHAHPDHYIWTVKNEGNVNVPVYLTKITFDYGKYKPANYRIIESGREYKLKDFKISAYNVIHSLRCPAIAYKIKGDKTIIYAPDILDFEEDKGVVLNDIDLLITDGSSLNINMVRRRDDKLFGHTRVKTIIGWCKKYNVEKLIITHCGKQIVNMDESELKEKLKEYAGEDVDVEVAHDNWKIEV